MLKAKPNSLPECQRSGLVNWFSIVRGGVSSAFDEKVPRVRRKLVAVWGVSLRCILPCLTVNGNNCLFYLCLVFKAKPSLDEDLRI